MFQLITNAKNPVDEPTSGMDSQTAWSICTLLRKLADNGQAILCTIHQPSSQLFCMFDQLLLLNKHGETIYFGAVGPNASSLLAYFESRAGSKCPPDVNPADWVLEITDKAPPSEGQYTWAEVWRAGPHYKDAQLRLSEFERLKHESLPRENHLQEYATPWMSQLVIVCKRLFQEYWRDPLYLYTKVALCIGMVWARSLIPHLTVFVIADTFVLI